MNLRALLLAALFPWGSGLGAAPGPGVHQVQGVLAAGGYHSLALDPRGHLWGWGLNAEGQLGDGTKTRRDVPVPAALQPGRIKLVALAAGEDHSLALGEDGSVWAFGANHHGQLGIGTAAAPSGMVEVKGLPPVLAVGAGQSHSVALDRGGGVWAWGGNEFGQLGRSPGGGSPSPVKVAGLADMVSLSVGWRHTLALKRDGTVWQWGGVESAPKGGPPVSARTHQVAGLPRITMVAAGGGHSLALDQDGSVWAWGDNDYGQVGDGTHDPRWKPILVPGVTRVRQVFAGYNHSVALLEDDSALAWGDNNLGQLGNPIPEASSRPVRVSDWEGPLVGIAAISCGGHHTLMLTRANLLLACGNNTFGQLGDWKLADSSLPMKVWKQVFR